MLILRISKWSLTVLAALLVVAFLLSSCRWMSFGYSNGRRDMSVGTGAVWIGWRPAGWSPRDEQSLPTDGWTSTAYGHEPPPLSFFTWWVEFSQNRHWESIAIPIWIPFAPIASIAAWLWWMDRRATARWLESVRTWLRPPRRKKVTILRCVLWTIIHFVIGSVVKVIVHFLFAFYWSSIWSQDLANQAYGIEKIIKWTLIWPSPLFGVLWAVLQVRFQNRLLAGSPQNCLECGYDLTGNVSGICPECGCGLSRVSR